MVVVIVIVVEIVSSSCRDNNVHSNSYQSKREILFVIFFLPFFYDYFLRQGYMGFQRCKVIIHRFRSVYDALIYDVLCIRSIYTTAKLQAFCFTTQLIIVFLPTKAVPLNFSAGVGVCPWFIMILKDYMCDNFV